MKKFIALLILFSIALGLAAAETVPESVVQMTCIVKLPDVIREGLYTGQVLNGVPNGYGLFETVNSEGIKWHYIGEWKDGSMTGKGGQYWNDGRCKYGTFESGDLVCGTVISDPQKKYCIDYLNAESGCVNIVEYRPDGTVYFDGCGDLESGQYHKGTVYTKDGKVFFSGEFGDGFSWNLIYTD